MDHRLLAQLAKEVNEEESTRDLKILELTQILENHPFLVKPRTGGIFNHKQICKFVHLIISNSLLSSIRSNLHASLPQRRQV